jgi:uncharacterized protein YoxC
MKARVFLSLASAAVFTLVSVVALQRNDDGSASVGLVQEADALFCCRRLVRAVSSAFRGVAHTVQKAGQAVGQAAKQVGQAVGQAAKQVGQAVGQATKQVGQAVGQAAKQVGQAVGQAAKQVGQAVSTVAKGAIDLAKKGVEGIKELAKKGLEGLKQVGELVKKGLMALGDLLKWVWESMRDKLLKPVGDYFKGLFDKAKAAMQQLVDKALGSLKGIFETKVLQPAVEWALGKILPGGQATLDKVKGFVQRILGKVQSLVERGNEFAETVQALAERNVAKYQAAFAKFEAGLNKWTNITLADIATRLVEMVKGKIQEFVRAKTIDLLDMAYGLVETPINAGKAAALGAISSIPFVGGVLSGAADVIITQGLKALREAGFNFVAEQAAKLAGIVVDKIGGYLVKGAAWADTKLQPIVAKVKPLIDRAMEFVQGVKDKWFKLRDKLRQAGELLAQAQAAVR